MANKLLEERIEASGLKKNFLAGKLGITRQALANKIDGRNEFTAREIKILCEELRITSLRERDTIFFA